MQYRPAYSFQGTRGDDSGAGWPFGGVAPFGGVPGWLKFKIFDDLDTYTVSPAANSTVGTLAGQAPWVNGAGTGKPGSGGTSIAFAGGLVCGHDFGVGGFQQATAVERPAPLFDPTRPYDLKARIGVASGGNVTLHAEGVLACSVNAINVPFGSDCVPQLSYYGGAMAAATGSAVAKPASGATTIYDVVMRVRPAGAGRVASFDVNGVNKLSGYTLAAYGGSNAFGFKLGYYCVQSTLTYVSSITLIQY